MPARGHTVQINDVEIYYEDYRSIPNAALWIIPGGDHVPIFDPMVPFTSTALRFLDAPDST